MKSSTNHEGEGESAASGSAHRIGREARRDVDAFRDSVARSASDLMDSMNARLRAAGVDTDASGEAARSQAGEMQAYVEREVRQHPLRAVGVALALGALVGFLSAR
jgi:ElaB/YqjD/DUF883 family membrane-anchored ribosome-binding protein